MTLTWRQRTARARARLGNASQKFRQRMGRGSQPLLLGASFWKQLLVAAVLFVLLAGLSHSTSPWTQPLQQAVRGQFERDTDFLALFHRVRHNPKVVAALAAANQAQRDLAASAASGGGTQASGPSQLGSAQQSQGSGSAQQGSVGTSRSQSSSTGGQAGSTASTNGLATSGASQSTSGNTTGTSTSSGGTTGSSASGGQAATAKQVLASFVQPVSGQLLPSQGSDQTVHIMTTAGDPVVAAGAGVVTKVSTSGGTSAITIKHDGGVVTWYGHLSQALVKQQDQVIRGQVIGRVAPSQAQSKTTQGAALTPFLSFRLTVGGQAVSASRLFQPAGQSQGQQQ